MGVGRKVVRWVRAGGVAAACGPAFLGATFLDARPAFAGDALLARQLTDRGIDLQQRNDHSAALRLFDAALVETDHPKIRYFRAKSLRALERRDEAIAEFQAILDRPEVEKYRTEIAAFISDMKSEKQFEDLASRLDAEKEARQRAEAERQIAQKKAEDGAIELLRRRRSGLMPNAEQRAIDGSLGARIVPLVPAIWAPADAYDGGIAIAATVKRYENYETELTASKILTVLAAVGVSVGVGVGLNPLADHAPSAGAQQAGLAIGLVGLVSGLAAAVVWPSTPTDPRSER
ncbi:MAG: hypothetical protein JNJ59_26490 [Deltaproteobacteria bacterium]|nr:hypothetical protein [Deltaproteobacteria bacterium]